MMVFWNNKRLREAEWQRELRDDEAILYQLVAVANANVARARRERRFQEFIFWSDVYAQVRQILAYAAAKRTAEPAIMTEMRMHMTHVRHWLGRPYNEDEEPDTGDEGSPGGRWWEWR